MLILLAKSVLIALGLSAGMSAADEAIQKKSYGRPLDLALLTTTLVIQNEEREDIGKLVKSPEESGLLIKWIRETIKNKTKKQKGGLLPRLLGTLSASTLGNALTGKWVIRTGERLIRVGQNF